MTLDLSYEPGPPPEILDTRDFKRRTLETWAMEGSAGQEVIVDAHLPRAVDRIILMAHGADNSRKARYIEVASKSFTRHGTAVIAMDAPRHGDRPGAGPLELLPGFSPELLEEWVRDHRRLLDAFDRRWPGVPVGLAGFSMGGLFGVPLLSVDDRLRGAAIVIAGSTTVSYPDRLELTEEQRATLDLTDPAGFAPRVGDRPILVLNADQDEIVSRAAGLALYDALAGPKEMVFMPGTHTEWGQAARWFRRLEAFFTETLS